jgi:phage terminase Nu1 subunit (DNA packaging protein)
MLSRTKRVTPGSTGVTPPRYTPAATIGKAALAEALGWTRPKLDRRLESDARFPVVTRGTKAGGWEFDLAAVRTYLDPEAPPASPPRSARPRPPPRRPAPPPPSDDVDFDLEEIDDDPPPARRRPPAQHAGESTAKQRKDAAQAAMLEDKLRLSRDELVEAEEMRTVLATLLSRLSKGIDGIPVLMVKRLGLDEDALPVLRELVDDLRGQMVIDLQKALRDDRT